MSKFFFKGRQDKRENHGNYGYQPKGAHKPGSKKYPLELIVTSAQRKAEIAQTLKTHELYGNIVVDDSEGAEENIFDLTALITKSKTVTVEKTPERNDPCTCGSGKKYKKCCGA